MQVNTVRFQAFWNRKPTPKPVRFEDLPQEDKDSIDMAIKTGKYDDLSVTAKRYIRYGIRDQGEFDRMPNTQEGEKKALLIKIFNDERWEYVDKGGRSRKNPTYDIILH